MLVLGISGLFHNSAAALVSHGEVVSAVEEERLSRRKNDPRFPTKAVQCCLDIANVTFDDVDLVAFYEKPHRKLARVLSSLIAAYPASRPYSREVLGSWASSKFWHPGVIRRELFLLSPSACRRSRWDRRLIFVPHHLSHAASAFYPSPFDDAAILVVDGVGEWATTTIASGRTGDDGRRRIELMSELRFPHSIGLLYSAFTHFLGFEVNEGEYKVMGLAPYGEPRHVDTILRHLLHLAPDGSFAINSAVLTYGAQQAMYREARMVDLFGLERRRPGEDVTQAHADLASSVQAVTEHVLLRLADRAHRLIGSGRLVLAGGVALNCVANGRLLQEGWFDDVWVQPAAGDAGGALGAALEAWYGLLGRPAPRRRATPRSDAMGGARLGPSYGQPEIRRSLVSRGVDHLELEPSTVAPVVARLLARGCIVGWFHGRMEFGPRALGGRSILADPRQAAMQRTLNLRIKGRESFRPFAPVVPREFVAEWFMLQGRALSQLGAPGRGYDSPYMLLVAPVRPSKRRATAPPDDRRLGALDLQRSEIASCTHVDNSARIQTVRREDDDRLHELLMRFRELTGVPVLLNTSFNRSGEPIVCSPDDAIDCFLHTDIDFLCMENLLAWKAAAAREALDHEVNALGPPQVRDLLDP